MTIDIIQLATGEQKQSEKLNLQQTYYSASWQTLVVANVSRGSLEVYVPDDKSKSNTALIIAPGGGMAALSIESEGRDVARWFNQRGITAFVLRYRLVCSQTEATKALSERWERDYNTVISEAQNVLPLAAKDMLDAIRFVRSNAMTYDIDPTKIGVCGFSAGGAVALHAIEKGEQATQPDFLIAVYPWTDVLISPPLKPYSPATFIACAKDDPIGLAGGAAALYQAYCEQEIPARLRLYEQGGHGFGMKKQGTDSDAWIADAHDWLKSEQVLHSRREHS